MITTIDCQYMHPRFAASYLVQDFQGSGRALFIDNNTAHSVPLLLKALAEKGMTPEQVEYVIITHVHLDHAGGSSALMKACPNATLLAHPKAAPHMIDPKRLTASAKIVYGPEKFREMYGEISPIPAERVRAMQDEELLPFGSSMLRFFHTRGHANHHFCVELRGPEAAVVFTGDAFGLAYPDVQPKEGGLFILPSTSPTDFDAEEARKSIDKIVRTGASTAYLTHFGGVTNLKNAAIELKEYIDFSDALLNEAAASSLPDEKLAEFCEERVRTVITSMLEAKGLSLAGEVEQILALDIELNAAGIAHVAHKTRDKQRNPS
jgi:glyoxylase-like metal-dependent hydrolase (beta-lactamase superfamily II)